MVSDASSVLPVVIGDFEVHILGATKSNSEMAVSSVVGAAFAVSAISEDPNVYGASGSVVLGDDKWVFYFVKANNKKGFAWFRELFRRWFW